MYTLYESKAAAEEAADKWVASLPEGWTTYREDLWVHPWLLAPQHRCDSVAGRDRAPEIVQRQVAKLPRRPLQWNGRPLVGFEIEASGPNKEDPTIFFWAAWHDLGE